MIHVQHQNGNGIVRDGKITGGEWSRVAKMTGVEMSGMGIFQNSDDMMINMLMMQFNMWLWMGKTKGKEFNYF